MSWHIENGGGAGSFLPTGTKIWNPAVYNESLDQWTFDSTNLDSQLGVDCFYIITVRAIDRAGLTQTKYQASGEIARMRTTLDGIQADTEPVVPPEYFESTRVRAVLMVELAIESFELESRWLRRVEERLAETSDGAR